MARFIVTWIAPSASPLDRERQEDRVHIERFLQRLGDNLRSNRTGLQFQLLGRAEARDRHVHVFTRKGESEYQPILPNPAIA